MIRRAQPRTLAGSLFSCFKGKVYHRYGLGDAHVVWPVLWGSPGVWSVVSCFRGGALTRGVVIILMLLR
jgi:hypothetical protein